MSDITPSMNAVETLGDLRADLLGKQSVLMGLLGSVIARRVVNLFDQTPRLRSLRISFDYKWTLGTDGPQRTHTATVDATMSKAVMGDAVVSTALDAVVLRGEDAASEADVAVDFNLALEASSWLRVVGNELDCGRTEACIEVSRRAIDRHRHKAPDRTDLAALGRLILSL